MQCHRRLRKLLVFGTLSWFFGCSEPSSIPSGNDAEIGNDDHNFSFVFDANGRAESVLAGEYTSELQIDGTSLSFVGGIDSYVIGLDPAGEIRFTTTLVGNGTERVTGVAASSDGRTVILGEFDAHAQLRTHLLEGEASGSTGFVAMLDETGEVLWSHILLGSSPERVDVTSTEVHTVALEHTSNALLVTSWDR